MPTFPSEPPSHGAPPSGAESYRLLVRASASGKKQFIWEIMDDTKGQCVEASRDTFRSFEDAYKAQHGHLPLSPGRPEATDGPTGSA